MPVYVYRHPVNNELYEDIRSYAEMDKPYIAKDGTECPRIPFFESIGILGLIDKNAEVWEKDSSYCKKMKPKYVRRRDGVREKYDPNRHC